MRFHHVSAWSSRLVRAVEIAREGREVEALRLLIEGLRPTRDSAAEAHVVALTEALEAGPDSVRTGVVGLLRDAVGRRRLLGAFTQSGVAASESFVSGLVGRLGRRLLPPVPDAGDLRDLLRVVFSEPGDEVWVSSVDERVWAGLLVVLGIDAETSPGIDDELALAIRILTQHVASLGLAPDLTMRLAEEAGHDSPFLRLGVEVLDFIRSFEDDREGDEEPLLERALATVEECRVAVERLRSEKHLHGTSVHLTGVSFRILTLLDRIDLLLHLAEPVERQFQTSLARLLKELVRAERIRDHIVPHVRASADLLAFQVVENAARTGRKYITRGRPEYYAFLRSSMGGGLLVGTFAMVKVLMGDWQVPLAAEALLYGLNYSACFVLIYLTGATLATKQPAMTANTVARSLGDAGHDLAGLEDLVVRVWRSQFVSFLGNLVIALPLGVLLAQFLMAMSGSPVLTDDGALYLLESLHPWRSASLVWAGVAGVLLFAAGLLSGWVDNFFLHRRVAARIEAHPFLVSTVGPRVAGRVARRIDRTAGVLVGNVFLGFGLGSMGTIGTILGLPLDIRHVAFASAQFGTALEVLHFALPLGQIAQIAVGVALIGLVNFLVSFGLSLAVAMESRGVTFVETRELLAHLAGRLWHRPLDWFFPPIHSGD
jgi:site-specific recombinase